MENYKKNLQLLTKNHVYSSEMEHDACGVGLIVSLNNKPPKIYPPLDVLTLGVDAIDATI